MWFPASLRGRVPAARNVFIKRDISVLCENSGFQRLHVECRMKVIGPVE